MEDLNLCVVYAEQLIERARARHQFSDAPIVPIAAAVPRLVRISRGGGESLAETRCPNAIQTKSARRKQHFAENVRGFHETNIHCRHSNGRAAGATASQPRRTFASISAGQPYLFSRISPSPRKVIANRSFKLIRRFPDWLLAAQDAQPAMAKHCCSPSQTDFLTGSKLYRVR